MSIQRAADPPINFIISGPPPSAIANCDRAITFGSGDDDDGVGGGGGEVEDGVSAGSGIAIISARLIRFMNWQNQGN